VLLRITVEPDKRFERRGPELATMLRVPYTALALGATTEVETLTGKEQLRIPAGTESHSTFTLRGHGLPRLRGGSRGNLSVTVVLDTPRKLSRRQRELLEELQELEGSGGEGTGFLGLGRRRRRQKGGSADS
jgi:molecular chaperone DnaJ